MRGLLLGIFISLMNLTAVIAQDVPHFETPSSPAFTILDFEPVSVLRPTSPSELKANVLSFFDKDGKYLINMGLEVSPFWLKSNPQLTAKEYLEPNPLQSIKQTFTLSFATVKDSASGPSRLGIGIKLQPISGKTILDPKAYESLSKVLNLIATVTSVRGFVKDGSISSRKDMINELIMLIKLDYGSSTSDYYERLFKERAKSYSDEKESMISFLEELNVEFNNQSIRIDVPRIRKGFLWEIAAASSFATEVSAESDKVDKYGIWTTLSYKDKPNEDFLLSIRYFRTNGDTLRSSFDAGLSYVKDYSNFNFSVEGILRSGSLEFDDRNVNNDPIRRIEKNFTYRLAITGQYKINPFIYFNISIGKNYSQPFQSEGQFFSTAGLSFNLFRPLAIAEKISE